MPDDRSPSDPPLDPDGIYRQIGVVVVAFQSLENEAMQICWLLTDPPYAPDGRGPLANLTFGQLVKEMGSRVDAFLARRNLDDSQFRRDFHRGFQELLEHCRALARLRNRIVHSAYVHLEGGGELQGILRSDMRVAADGDDVDFDQELLSTGGFDAVLHDLAWTTFSLGQCKRQLIAWHGHDD